MGNRNSAISKERGQAAKVASPPLVRNSERATNVAAKVEPEPQYVPRQGKPSTKAEVEHSEQHGKKSVEVDNDDTFTDYIRRAKYKIRTLSNIGRGQSNPAPDEANGGGTNKKLVNQEDQFSDFIQLAKKKLRTTSSIGKNSSFKRG